MNFSKKLQRQLKKTIASQYTNLCEEQSEEINLNRAELCQFLTKVDIAYAEYDDRLNTSYRNMLLSNAEIEKQHKSISNLNRSLKDILDSLGEGLLRFNPDGMVGSNYSKVCEDIFGENIAGKNILEVLDVPDFELETYKTWLELIFEDKLTEETMNDLGPSEFTSKANHYYTLSYKPIYKGDSVEFVTLIATDCTNERREKELKEIQERKGRIIEAVLKSKNDFNMFMSYFKNFLFEIEVDAPCDDDEFKVLKMGLHTIKGSAGFFLLTDLADLVHDLELSLQQLSDNNLKDRQLMQNEVKNKLANWFEVFVDEFEVIYSKDLDVNDTKQLSKSDIIQKIDRNLRDNVDRSEWILSIVGDPIEAVLDRFRLLGDNVAKKLGKEINPIELDTDEFNIMSENYSGLINSFAHIIRNSIDHGIESTEERLNKGKSAKGNLSICAKIEGDESKGYYHFVFKDDGRGFDIEGLKKKLQDENEYSITDDNKVIEKTLEGGVSSRDSQTDISGFGIGISAVFNEVKKVHGKIQIQSVKDKGATITISIPKALVSEEDFKKHSGAA